MSFANQGAISGARANTNSLFRGTTAGSGANAAYAFNLEEFDKEVERSVERDVGKLKTEVENAKNSDLKSLDKQYDKMLDSYIDKDSQKTLFDNAFEKYKGDLDKQFNSKKKGLSSFYLGKLTTNYNNALSSLKNDLNSQIKKIADVATKAKDMKFGAKADAKLLDVAEIRNLQNQLLDNKQMVEDSYKQIYTDNIKIIKDNYVDYRDNILSQFKFKGGRSMYGKAIMPKHNFKIRRLYPKLRRPHIVLRVNMKKVIGLRSYKLKKEIKDLDYQLTRNFRRML